MKVKLAVAFAVLLFAVVVRADEVDVNGIPITIPDGSTVTAVTTSETPDRIAYNVLFNFADGTGNSGFILDNGDTATGGELSFTSPVSDVEFSYETGDFFQVSDNLGEGGILPMAGCCGTLAGPGITNIDWQAASIGAGITSLSYTVPEPSSLLLSGIGLTVLIGLARRG